MAIKYNNIKYILVLKNVLFSLYTRKMARIGYQGYNFGFRVPFDLEIRQISNQKSVFGFAKRNTPLFFVVPPNFA